VALALYRKYRPRTFAEIIGQEHVTEPLSQALRTGRLNHAYLFSGPRGCGKTSSARILARSLNCERGPTPEPCGECQSCRDLAPDGAGSIDVIEIDAASHGGVDDARDLRERAFFAPVSSRFKVYVIDEAHMVSSAGFNALLKLVEEPPDFVKFVFATTEPEKVLGTIKSRTHHYPFRLIPPGVLRPYLEQLTAAEKVEVEPAVFPLVVRAGAGSARDALSVLDQLIAGAGPGGVTYSRAVALLGVTDVALIDEMCDALAADDGRGAYGVIDRVVEAGHDPRRFASDLLERLRDLIVLQQVPDAVTKGLLDAPHDQLERMGAQATQLGQATLSRFADIVNNGLTEMRGTTAPRLLLELVTARMLLPGADNSSSALLQRLERMERRLMAGGVPAAPAVEAAAASAPVSAPQPADPAPGGRGSGRDAARAAAAGGSGSGSDSDVPGPVPSPPAHQPASDDAPADPEPVSETTEGDAGGQPAAEMAGGGLDAAAVRRVWSDVLSLVSGKSKKAAAIVREATVQDVEGNTLVLGFKYSTHANMLNASPDVLLAALQELLGGRWQVRCEIGGQPGGGGGNRPATPKPTPQPPSPPAASPPPASPSTASTPLAAAPPARASAMSGASSGGSSSDAVSRAPVAAGQVPQQSADDWPTPATPGGAASAAQSAAQSGGHASAGGGAVEDWPTPAIPGGVAQQHTPNGAAAEVPRAVPAAAQPVMSAVTAGGPGANAIPAAAISSASTVSVSASTAAAPAASVAGPGRGAANNAAPGRSAAGPGRPRQGGASGVERAREAASRAASGANGPRRPASAAAPAGDSVWEGAAADEPPFDPEYDQGVPDPRFPGLDPGDELLDDANAVRESSEEAALRLLTEALGAEKIGESTG
jgi:DNA polymerase-3 subunit gamma/tau